MVSVVLVVAFAVLVVALGGLVVVGVIVADGVVAVVLSLRVIENAVAVVVKIVLVLPVVNAGVVIVEWVIAVATDGIIFVV